jgi:hypothetical protein
VSGTVDAFPKLVAHVERAPQPLVRENRMVFAVASTMTIYVFWVVLTWLLEGRTELLLRYDPPARAAYALLTNVSVGTIVAIATARMLGLSTRGRRHPTGRTFEAAIATVVLVAIVAVRVGDALVFTNACAQVLPTSIAEIAVCWMLVGGVAKRLARPFGRTWSLIAALAVSDVAFAAYHVAHSPPYNELGMMLFLLLPGLVIGALVFWFRSATLAVSAQTAFAILGMAQKTDPRMMMHPYVWAYAIAAASVLAFALTRRLPKGFAAPWV